MRLARKTFAAAAIVLGSTWLGCFGAASPSDATPTTTTTTEATTHPLVWDAVEKVLVPKLGEHMADFQFTVVNTSDKPVAIEQIRPTCGCTIVELPSTPWVIPAKGDGTFTGTIDFRGHEGTLTKAIFVNATVGTQMLRVTVKIPVMDEATRERFQQIARADRQAIFRGECAACHVAPSAGKTGTDLFTAACGVCHLTSRRANFVPDLLTARQHRDATYWRTWITEGKAGTLMPAWSIEHGGPLTKEQIDSLVDFALSTLPTEPPPIGTAVPVAASASER